MCDRDIFVINKNTQHIVYYLIGEGEKWQCGKKREIEGLISKGEGLVGPTEDGPESGIHGRGEKKLSLKGKR